MTDKCDLQVAGSRFDDIFFISFLGTCRNRKKDDETTDN
jgi:hypothetical protein